MKSRIFVCKVLSTSGDKCVVKALSGDEANEIQVCFPISCGIEKYVNQEVDYEIKNGRVRISEVRYDKERSKDYPIDKMKLPFTRESGED